MVDNKISSAPIKYDNTFAKEIYSLENGHYVKMCMQCGMCAVSCATRQIMDYSPRRLFNLIRAGKKEEFMRSNTMWMCTTCCMCKVRCPRGIPLVDVMHDLKALALKQGYVEYPQAAFYQAMWAEAFGRGRVFEGGIMARFYLKRGWNEIKKALGMKDLGMEMLKHGRMPIVPPRKIKGLKSLQQIIQRAQSLQEKEAK
ncbi:succinate dehydrogenase iron-sulfur protein [Desulfocucumis palustris]|uniref:Succinate dehydrogenase iron-sulfur protein n=1 Tax=Desulfocucumis palustris TaxID=1898651 RepID=A0A2L2XEQ5_9FIRM|nr:4Fe-4S dicluster domain-containing protein [Desulfocucumis palustris]GBF34494.1 succinate dehydrogenase iron-sulfur protein [Desulfocucumis palustris]